MSSKALIHLDRLDHNLALLAELAGGRPLWPAIKANAYGHGAELVARHLRGRGHGTFCVAHAAEAVALLEAGIDARFLVMSAMLPDEATMLVAHGLEPAVCTRPMLEALSRAARDLGREAAVHLKVDTGMGRAGIAPGEVEAFLDLSTKLPQLRVAGLMSHFPRADEADKDYSLAQLRRFQALVAATAGRDIGVAHMANSAALFDLPGASFDAARPGISIYGLAPSAEVQNPRVRELKPVLEWKAPITLIKGVPAGTGLSYGHSYRTTRDSIIATVPVGYGDGLHRNLSNRMQLLVGGRRCDQVGRITMDQLLVDVTELGGAVGLGDEVVIVGRQGEQEIGADELAARLGTINYEIVTAITARVPRQAAGEY
ncbi:MAG: alanine racemase [Myxococcales bacterium]|nr:alanine racemase [Myxococcales bacterium]